MLKDELLLSVGWLRTAHSNVAVLCSLNDSIILWSMQVFYNTCMFVALAAERVDSFGLLKRRK
ncbi:hypothetical protein GCM10011274_26110 [Paraglaciecola chathamensis]|uniref:Uncharacterized protein n=1 Tax=Paraglaciecola chathamensis TaxID=368405 RepID=A0A8H9M1D7_9ALTE|nr:hypothetical protein GCM10011274_26110 [Paraglaciecola oceanifecundans]